jgi:hypothetical protein
MQQTVLGGPGPLRSWSALFAGAGLLASTGCTVTMPDRAQRMPRGYVYYLDGAGGGQPWSNWAGGVRSGLLEAGYDGAGEMFTWETGLGVAADQVASNEYKRGKAVELARKIAAYRQKFPSAPITLLGLSAGTAIAVFTLEALPPDDSVDNVILLSGSLSSYHDLTRALAHVQRKVYVFTSQRDAVLQVMLPLGGTADRGSGTTETIGVEGVKQPAGATAETRRLYAAKIVEVPWNAEFAAYGHQGGHTDSVKGPFVERFVAPLVKTTTAAGFASAAAAALPAGKVANPDFARWAAFAPGSWALLEGEQVVDGARQPVRVKATLVSKSAGSLAVQREVVSGDGGESELEIPRKLFVTAAIEAAAHPMTNPKSRIETLRSEEVAVGGRKLLCEVKRIASPADSPVWGRDVRGTVYTCHSVPGGIVRIDLETTLQGRRIRLVAALREFVVSGGPLAGVPWDSCIVCARGANRNPFGLADHRTRRSSE